jgi:D-glycero-alpha-D-manno-heptose-7-phosphate kinase
LIKALATYQGRHVGQEELARSAIHVERNVLNETVGLQDQILAAYGGLNVIRFRGEADFVVERVPISQARLDELAASLLLFFTGLTRRAHDVERSKVANVASIQNNLKRMLVLVDQAYDALTGNGGLSTFGRLLHETWMEKRQLDPAVTAPEIDRLYEQGIAAGALGGKLLGAGGGGFMLFFVPAERQAQVRKALSGYHEVPFAINAPGSTIIHS